MLNPINNDVIERIEELKKQKNAVILAHVYQRGDVQDIADYVGDSLDLSKKAVRTKANVIVFCGVQFMAETAVILNPQKVVLLPDKQAGCGLADMAAVARLRTLKQKYPAAAVVSYINSSAGIKAESDICCTSANAIEVVNSLPHEQILFVPDRNLGSHVAEHTNKEVILWDGYCYVHEKITVAQIQSLQKTYPEAEVIVHPECTTAVRHLADFVGSTSQMSRYVFHSRENQFIVGTEDNFVYRLKKDNPGKIFYPVGTLCEGMSEITLEKVRCALEQNRYRVKVKNEIQIKARKALSFLT